MSSNKINADDIFQCTLCGDCCKGFGGTYVTEDDIRAIAELIGVTPEEFIGLYCQMSGEKPLLAQQDNGYCVFWDKVCTIHSVKPEMCQAWPYIKSVLIDVNNWHIMASMCPGIRTDASDEDICRCVHKQRDSEKKSRR